MKILLVDLSSVFFPIWHMSGKEPNVDHASQATVSRVRALATGFDHVAVCCDAGRSFRKDIHPEYKANRPEKDEALLHQLRLARETLADDGFPVWGVKGFEADDVIATAVERARAVDGAEVVIASSDKDLLQLVCEGVSAKSLTNGSMYDAAAVEAKFGVRPDQIRDYLVLVGDASDNIKGVNGIGEKRAAAILQRHGSLFALYQRIEEGPDALGLTPSIHRALVESINAVELGRRLVSLRVDVPIPFDHVFEPRAPKLVTKRSAEGLDDPNEVSEEQERDEEEEEENVETIDRETGEVQQAMDVQKLATPTAEIAAAAQSRPQAKTDVGNGGSSAMVLGPPSWDLALEPTSPKGAFVMAEHIYGSRLFSNMPNAEAVFAVILMGRTLGIDTMTMLRNVHVIEGKLSLGAHLIVGLVLRSGKADYFKCVETTNERAVYKTHRKGDPDAEPTILEYTIDDAKRQLLLVPVPQGKQPGNWHKIPKTMLRIRCSTELARAVYPDVVAGLVSPDELGFEAPVGDAA